MLFSAAHHTSTQSHRKQLFIPILPRAGEHSSLGNLNDEIAGSAVAQNSHDAVHLSDLGLALKPLEVDRLIDLEPADSQLFGNLAVDERGDPTGQEQAAA